MNEEKELDDLIDNITEKRFDIHWNMLTKYIEKEFPKFLSENILSFCGEPLIQKFIDQIHRDNKIKIDSFYIDNKDVMKNDASFYMVIKKPNSDEKLYMRINSKFSI